ncbi:MAG: hypothetical protein AB1437_06965 [Pseudomonadota bacterium]
MLKNVEWKENGVYSLKLRDDLYTVVQMRKNYIMQFFDYRSETDDWPDLNLNRCPTLFFRFVAPKGLKGIFSRRISFGEVVVSDEPIQRKMLTMDLVDAPNYGAKLIELPEDYNSINAKVLTGRLTVGSDLDAIYRYELDGSEGSSDKLLRRLKRYFETGINWDDSKNFLFKGVPQPPPYYGRS